MLVHQRVYQRIPHPIPPVRGRKKAPLWDCASSASRFDDEKQKGSFLGFQREIQQEMEG